MAEGRVSCSNRVKFVIFAMVPSTRSGDHLRESSRQHLYSEGLHATEYHPVNVTRLRTSTTERAVVVVERKLVIVQKKESEEKGDGHPDRRIQSHVNVT